MTMPILTADVAVYRTSLRYHYNPRPPKDGAIILSQSQPNGTYLQSCFNCSFDEFIEGGNLSCQCYDFNGNAQVSSINPDLCGSRDIANCNGNLMCGPCS